ncbi:MAG: CBS domain-containing protein [Candidatus Anstonellales archaeon]
MKIKDIMRKEFVLLRADDSLEHVLKTFAKEGITSAPVVDDGIFIGVVSESSLLRYLSPQKFLFFWKRDKPKSIDEIRRITASNLAKKATLTLKPDNELIQVIWKIAANPYCVPILDKNKLVGIIRGEDILQLFLKELAVLESEATNSKKEWSYSETQIDKILEMIRTKGSVSCNELARELNTSQRNIERICSSLHKHHLIKFRYSFFRGAIAERLEHETK